MITNYYNIPSEFYYFALFLFFLLILIIFLIKILKKEKLPYIKKPLLSQNELRFYKKLRKIAYDYDMHILSKIRMADIIEVKSGQSREAWGRYFNKIKAKHVDFALAEPDTLEIIALIELDDSSHQQKDREKRDSFVDDAYAVAGIPIIHTYGKDMDEFTRQLNSILKSYMP